ncbi:MAG: spermidine/putrescine ABC transporter substrate-binding protein [Ruminococcaceae bacterium]|nr:spermidine/putrescine ABC transporter substrate-binding protein [Oscillospiraceae bacterium]
MKRFLTTFLVICILSFLFLFFTSCDSGGNVTTLYVYNWGEYISDGSEGSLDVNAAFEVWYEQAYGQKIKVNYSTFSSNEDMYAKLVSGATSYDIVIPSDYMVERLLKEDMLRPLNTANIPNLQNIDMTAVIGEGKPYYDIDKDHSDKTYSVPYTYGTVGIIYNKTMLRAEDLAKIEAGEGSWDIMWDEHYKGNILQFNNSRDAFATAMFKEGYLVNTTSEAEWRAALDALMKQKPIVQGYVMDEIYNKMSSGSAALAPYYAGDFFTMYEDNEDLGFFYPTEGTNVFVDAMCIPNTSKNPELAELYINFMLSEEAATANAEYICYATPNKLVRESEDYIGAMEELHPDAMSILYDTDGIQLQFYENLDEEQLVLLNNLWEELKIESSIGSAIMIIACVIAGAAIGLGIFFFVRRRRRKRYTDTLWEN